MHNAEYPRETYNRIMSDQNGNSTTDSSDDLSGLTGFFFYMFIVHPITAWILKPGRFERQKSIYYAIIFLAGLAAVKTGTSFQMCYYYIWMEKIHLYLFFLFLLTFARINKFSN